MLTIVDVSMWQGVIDWPRVKADGIGLAWIKATDGRTGIDPRFVRNRGECQRLGIRCGFYCFAEPSSGNPEAQAGHFANVVGTLRRRELRPVFDLETGSPGSTEGFARAYCKELRRRLGVWPIFYSYPAYIAAMGLHRPIGDGLWLASYGRNDGKDYGATVPRPWRRWIAHQYTSSGHAPGIAGRVDFSHAPRLGPLLAHPVGGRL